MLAIATKLADNPTLKKCFEKIGYREQGQLGGGGGAFIPSPSNNEFTIKISNNNN